jgi:hypothetical protein
MKKKDLLQYRSAVAEALAERIASGDFDANARHMRLLLGGMLELLDNAIKKPEKK